MFDVKQTSEASGGKRSVETNVSHNVMDQGFISAAPDSVIGGSVQRRTDMELKASWMRGEKKQVQLPSIQHFGTLRTFIDTNIVLVLLCLNKASAKRVCRLW